MQCHILILICRFVPSETEVSFSWDGFVFVLPVLFYEFGIGTADPSVNEVNCKNLVSTVNIVVYTMMMHVKDYYIC